MRRSDRSGRLDRERDPGLPLADRDLGGLRPGRIRLVARIPGRSRQGVAVLQAADRDADRGSAQCRAIARSPRSRRPASSRLSSPRTSTSCTSVPAAATSSRCTGRSAPRRVRLVARSYPRAAVVAKLERADAPTCDSCDAILKPDVVFFGELLPRRCDRAGLRARTAGAAAARGRFLARGASRRRAALRRHSRPAAASRSSTKGRRRTTGEPS